MKILNDSSYDVLKEEFGHMSVELFQNENKNKKKSTYARRFSIEVKKFALTLHYCSPKAYKYCRLAWLFFSLFYYLLM